MWCDEVREVVKDVDLAHLGVSRAVEKRPQHVSDILIPVSLVRVEEALVPCPDQVPRLGLL